MGKRGGSGHMKREAAPQFWPIHRKEFHWAMKPRPGAHPTEQCIPLALILREMLGYAKTRREAKQIISQGKVKVDGKVRKDDLHAAGLMDVISMTEIGRHFRILPSEKGLILHPIDGTEAEFKLCRIEDKTTMKNGHVQLGLHDGRTILIHVGDPQNPEEDIYGTLDTLKIKLDDQSILDHMKVAEGMFSVFTGGKNIGKYGEIISVENIGVKRRKSLVTIEDERGERYQTVLDYVFILGDEKSNISLPRQEAD
ncbi:MAG: 30S ribosomal protein S4e [Candidatus Bathyarchaeota archaeon]|nr:30S ribosomal protein S4e [Candidatus Bathyarchaeota archaeon]